MTDRYVLTFKPGMTDRGIALLSRVLSEPGIPGHAPVEDPRFPPGDPSKANGITVHRNLGLAVVPARLMERIPTGPASPVLSHELERQRVVPEEPATPGVAPHSWGLRATGVSRSTYSGRGVKVAILDSGIDMVSEDGTPTYHPDLEGRRIVAHSCVPRCTPRDEHGHGTHLVGIACGPARPTTGSRYGVAHDADIYACKVLRVVDGALIGKDAWILDGITWALEHKVDIVCLAFTERLGNDPGFSAAYERLGQLALAQGTLILAAAGNASARPERIAAVGEPANCPSILAVTAIDLNDRVGVNACAGVHPNGGDITVAAPGVNVDSIWRFGGNKGHVRHTGTSQAAAFAAGVAALHAEALPEARGKDLWKALRRTARKVEPFEDFGFGVVQAP